MSVSGFARSDESLHRRSFVFLAAAGGLLRIVPAWLPLDWQLGHILSDDAFYYFTIARRLARDGFPSFDGLGATNGFHPLWLAIITPVYSLSVSDPAALRIILTLSTALDTASLVLLMWVLRSLHAGSSATLMTAALYAFSPALLSHAGPLNGMETSLAVFLLFALIGSYCAALRNKQRWYTSAGALGALMGLVMLARTDTVFIVAPLGLTLGLSHRPDSMRFALRTATVALIMVSPWLFWNLATFGTVEQVSGRAYALSMNALHQTDSWGAAEYALRFATNLADVFRFFPVKLESDTKLSIPFILQVTVLAGVLLTALRVVVRRRTHAGRVLRTRILFLLAPLTGGVLFILAHSLRTIALRGWYYAMVLPVLFLLMGAVADYLFREFRGGIRRGVIVAVSVVFTCLIVLSAVGHLKHDRGERPKFAALPALNSIVPPGGIIGSWNAGLYGYFLRDRMVVNLDGLVNNAAYPHLVDRSLGKYCRTAGISYLVDMAGTFKVWDPFWSRTPGRLMRSLGTMEGAAADVSDTAIIIASIGMDPSYGE